jgi:beta-phosphoglucomutase-like phosphatase (HAD superfamily)
MKGSKQSKADHQAKQIQALINVVQQLLDETAFLKDLSVGTLETVKLMPGYQAALMQLKEQVEEQKDETNNVE